MSLPSFSTQAELFSTAALSASLFGPEDRFRIFGKLVYPRLAAARPKLAKCYCAENGRTAIEPVLMMGISILQWTDGVPDRQAVEMLRYHAGWNFALNRQLGDALFHPTSLVKFRNRLLEHQESAVVFKTVLDGLQEAGLISRQSRQRLDSTQMMGLVSRMSRLDCVRESIRLALQELEESTPAAERPPFWVDLWERYVESQVDYRASSEILGRKLGEAGVDAWRLLEWVTQPEQVQKAAGAQVQLLRRVFEEQFEVLAGKPAPLAKEKEPVVEEQTSEQTESQQPSPAEEDGSSTQPTHVAPSEAIDGTGAVASGQRELAVQVLTGPAQIQPKAKTELGSDRVQNPHEPEATYAVKGQGQKKKEHVGYKVQVAETVTEAILAPGEPTRNFISGIVTHPAYESDEAGAEKMEQEQTQMGMEKPPVQYVDGAYVSAQKLAQAQAEGRELIGPAQSAPRNIGARFTAEAFAVSVSERQATCPAGKTSTQCSRLEESSTGKVSYRFEFGMHCHDCALRDQCVGKDQRHRTLVVGEHHSLLQARRQVQQTAAFKQRMKHRSGIEGTQSELVRGHGMRRARYRGLAKVRLQNYFIGAACNVKRWIRREVWKLRQAAATASTHAADVASAPAN